MHIRQATISDLSDMATIMANCNETDTLVKYITRDIFKYYTSYRLTCFRFLRSKIFEKGNIAFVAVTDLQDHMNNISSETTPSKFDFGKGSSGSLVVGFAIWHRFGDSERAQKWYKELNSDWSSMLERARTQVEDRYYQLFPSLDKTSHREHFKKFSAMNVMSWDPEIFPEAWELALCFVHPNWQRRGLAKMLLQFGFERGQDEMVPVVIKGSPVGGLAYRKAGFQSVDYLNLDELFDQTEFGGEKMQSWVWEPEGKLSESEPLSGTDDSNHRWIAKARQKSNWTKV